jgi:TldD protein
MRTGGLAIAGAMTMPSFAKSLAAEESLSSVANAMRHFGVTEADIRKTMVAGLERGGDYVDLFFEHTFSNNVGLQDGAVNRTSSHVDFGVGVRVLSGDQSGYAYIENVTLDELLRAARTAARIANSATKVAPVSLTERPIKDNFHPVLKPWEEVAVSQKMPYIQRLNDKIMSLDPRVQRVTVGLNDTTSHILFCNSEGVTYYDYRPMVTLNSSCVMEENGQIQTGRSSRGFRKGFEFVTDDIIDLMARETVDSGDILFRAITPRGGSMPVVFGAGASGIFLHEAIGHAFEADFIRTNQSIYSDMLNKKICNENVTVVDNPTVAFNRGSLNIDDEGVFGKNTTIVENGVLTSFLHDRISAKHFGIEPTGNGRRQSFRHIAIPRMTVTYMLGGNMAEADIIASVNEGIYVDSFTNGQVQIGAGDFTFFVRSGYLIENGKLTQPIKDVNIIGNGPRAMSDVTMVANNLEIDNGTWTCGKSGQGVPAGMGMPSILVSSLTVGGSS